MKRSPWLVMMPLLLAALAGCHVDPTYGGELVSCSTDADCAGLSGGPFACDGAAGLCVRTDGGGTDGGGLDGGATDGGATDGGAVDGGSSCRPACPAGASCVDGACARDAELSVTVSSPDDGAVVGDSVTVEGTVTGAVGQTSASCAMAGGAEVAGQVQGGVATCTVDLTGSADGEVAVTITVSDALGGEASDQVTLVRDGTPPEVTLIGPSWLVDEAPDVVTVADGKVWLRSPPRSFVFEAAASDAHLVRFDISYEGSGARRDQTCPADPGTANTCDLAVTGPQNLTEALRWQAGEYVFTAESEDAAGHVTTQRMSFWVSDALPEVTVVEAPQAAVRRDEPAVYRLRVTHPYHDLARVRLLVPHAQADGSGLVLDAAPDGNAAGVYVATVPDRTGADAPWLPAVEKTWADVSVEAVNTWGRSATDTIGDLTITRVPWAPVQLSNGSGWRNLGVLSPAVASNGTVYVVARFTDQMSQQDRLFGIDGASGQQSLAVQVPLSEAGPLIQEIPGGRRLFLLGQYGALYARDDQGGEVWSAYGNGAQVVGLPALVPDPSAGDELAVPTYEGVGCLSFIDAATGPATAGDPKNCTSGRWSDVSVLARPGRTGTVAVASDVEGALVRFGWVGSNFLAYPSANARPRVGELAGWVNPAGSGTAADVGFFLGHVPADLSQQSPSLERLPWPPASLIPDPGSIASWAFDLPGLTRGAVHDGTFAVTGGAGAIVRVNIADPTQSTQGVLGQDEVLLSASIGADGLVYAYTEGRTADHLMAFDFSVVSAEGGASLLWTYDVPPPSGTAPRQTAVLGPHGFLYVPGGDGTLRALITDSPAPAAGWSNVRGDPQRTASMP